MSDARLIRADGIDLCMQTFGSSTDPAVLLIGGAGASMDWWDDACCERLARGRRHMIRYDQRDTGRSTHWPAGQPGYALPDLVEDAAALLEALDVQRAHLIGISMGATVALRLALDHPERVASLVLMSSSPAGPGGPQRPDLPPMAPALAARFAMEPAVPRDWHDREAVATYLLGELRALAGSLGFDERRARDTVTRVLDRSTDIEASMANHRLIDGGPPLRPQLHRIGVPTLVLHGTDDPLFPLPHGEALAREIPHARLLALAGMGHEVPPPSTWDIVIPALLRHSSNA